MTITFHVSSLDHLLIKAGQEVDFKTPLIKKVYTTDVKVNIAQKLQIPPQNIFIHMAKVVGDEIQKGEVLAKKKTLISEKSYVSEYAGIVKEINHNEGSLLISTKTKKEEITNAYFKGKVEEVKKNEVTLEVKKAKVFPAKSISDDFGGEVLFFEGKSLDTLTEENIRNKVLFADTIKSYNRVKFEVMGILGLVTVQDVSEESGLPRAMLKSGSELAEIKELEYPYCLVSKKNNLIYLYQ
jgi:hypothetical protein